MRHFETFQEAFDFCRREDHPVTVGVSGGKWKLYPSGRADWLASIPVKTDCGRKGENTTDNDTSINDALLLEKYLP